MLHFLGTGGKLGLAAAVYDVDLLGAQALGSAHSVHSNVAAAYHHNAFARVYRRVVVRVVSAHQVIARQELIGRIDAVEVLAGDAHETRQTGARADEDGVEALLVHQRVDGDGASGHHVGLYLHAKTLHGLHLGGHHALLGQSELRNAVYQHTANLVQRLENLHLIPGASQVAGTGQSRRTRAYHSHLALILGRFLGRLLGRGIGNGPVAHKAFELAYAHRLALDAQHARTLALGLLRTHTAAHSRQTRVLSYDAGGSGNIALAQGFDKLRNLQIHRAPLYAARVLAVQTAFRLGARLLLVIAQTYFFEIACSLGRILLANRHTRFYIGHGISDYRCIWWFWGCCDTYSGAS